MHAPVERNLVTSALIDMLVLVTGRPMSVGMAPTDATGRVLSSYPYAVIFPRDGGPFTGPPFGAMNNEAAFGYQITSVGERPDQADALSDRIRTAILAQSKAGPFLNPLVIPEAHVMMRESMGPPGRLTREGRIYNVVDSYIIRVTRTDEEVAGS